MDFKKFIIENHPDPDSVFGIDKYDFEQIVVLAENFAKKELEQCNIDSVSSPLPQWTNNDVDAAYLIGCMNAGGLDSIPKEIERLKQLGLKPHEAVKKIRGKR